MATNNYSSTILYVRSINALSTPYGVWTVRPSAPREAVRMDGSPLYRSLANKLAKRPTVSARRAAIADLSAYRAECKRISAMTFAERRAASDVRRR